jgi:hypothetical protein
MTYHVCEMEFVHDGIPQTTVNVFMWCVVHGGCLCHGCLCHGCLCVMDACVILCVMDACVILCVMDACVILCVMDACVILCVMGACVMDAYVAWMLPGMWCFHACVLCESCGASHACLRGPNCAS